jgi:hypothetical protein
MMHLPDLPEIEAAAQVVYRHFQATPQYRWALLSERLGTDCWVKHENHTPVGAFKVRGGLTYFEQLVHSASEPPGEVISATRGNHGQSVGWAAARPRPELHHRRAARQLGGEERGHARPGRHAARARRRLPGKRANTRNTWRPHAVRTWCPVFTRP